MMIAQQNKSATCAKFMEDNERLMQNIWLPPINPEACASLLPPQEENFDASVVDGWQGLFEVHSKA